MKNKWIFITTAIVLVVTLSTLVTVYILNNNDDSTSTSFVDSTINVNERDVDWDSYSVIELENSSDEDVNITSSGVYNLDGTINGKVIINTEGNVKLILDNVTINSDNGPCILVQEAENVTIEMKDGSVNTLSDSTNYTGYEEEDATIFSHDDLELVGNGTLIINAKYADAIVSKDDLTITSGTYKITSVDDAIRGKDSVYIIDGDFTINAKGDGIKSTNETEVDKGYILIENGTFNINSVNDAIEAVTKLVIKDGDFTIKTTGNANSDTAKGLKAGSVINVVGGTFNITTTDDGIHTNGDIVIDGGNITTKSDDDAIHADGLLEINNGTLNLTAHEGLEATYVKINDGTIKISASDDGINAGNKSNNYKTLIEINGGNITITMGQGDTDGVDSNGDIVINGGTISVTGQSTFDYDGTGKINGGTVICNGQEVTTLPNQMMGGGQGGMRQQNMQGRR